MLHSTQARSRTYAPRSRPRPRVGGRGCRELGPQRRRGKRSRALQQPGSRYHPQLARLAAPAVCRKTGFVGTVLPPRVVAAVHDRTRGHPLYVDQMLTLLRRQWRGRRHQHHLARESMVPRYRLPRHLLERQRRLKHAAERNANA